MKKIFAVLCILASTCAFGQSYTAVTATNVQVDNGSGGAVNPPSGSNLCFLGVNNVGAAITYTPSGGSPVSGAVCQTMDGSGNLTGSLQVANPATASPIGLLYTITVVNGSTTYLTIPEVSISGALFQFSNFTLPVNGKALGIGFPHLSCTAGALWTSTTLPSGQQAFTCHLVSGVGAWQSFPKGGVYCPAGMGYVTPQVNGTPFCIPPVISGIGPPSGSCINGSTYYQQDNPGVVYGCVNGAWSPVAGGGVPGLTSFQGRSTPGANLQSSDITGILQNGPFGLTGTQGMLFDASTGTAQPSSNWVLGTGGNAGKLYGYKDLNLAPNNSTSPVASISAATGAATLANGNATVSAAGVAAVAAGSTVNGSLICTPANGACPTSGAAYYQTAQNATTPLTQRSKMNFISSSGITGVDDSGNASTDVSLSSIPNTSLANNTITVNVTGSATGGGTIPLGGSTTINVTGASGSVVATPQFYMFLQPNAGTQAVAQGAAIGQNGVAPMMQGQINADLYATGGGNNGIANAIASSDCVTGGCYFARPQTSTDTENIVTALNSASEYVHALDSQYGTLGHYFHNTGLNLSSNSTRIANPMTCVWNDVLANPFSKQYCNATTYASNSAGVYVSGSPTADKINFTNMYSYGRSIAQRDSTVTVCYHVGDCMDGYHYMFFRGGAVAANDETDKGNVIEMQEVAAPYGTVVTGGANATFIKGNWGGSLGVAGDGQNLVDTSQVLDSSLLNSCSVGGGQLPNFCTTSTTHAVDTGYATLASSCGTTTTRNAPISTTCTITGLVGSFSAAANATVCVADWSHQEQAAITAVSGSTITLNLAYSHAAGVRIEQGGLCGGMMALGYGLTDPSSTHQITSYFVAGSPTSTTVDYVLAYRGGSTGAATIVIPSLPVINLAGCGTLTRASNVVTTTGNCAAGSAFNYNNFVAPGASTIVIAGATPSDLNGVVTNVKVTNTNISWSQTGANETGSGGTLSLTGYNNEVTYCGAETVYVPNMTMSSSNVPTFDGTLQVDPNNCNWTVGDSIIQPNHYSTYVPAVQWLTAQGTTHGGLATNIGIELGLTGSMFGGATDIDVFEGDASTSMVGLGGTITPHLFVHDREFYGTAFLFDNAPLNGGSIFNIGAPVGGAFSSSYSYPLFQTIGVNGTSLFSFNPGSSTFSFNSPVFNNNYFGSQGAIGVGNIPGLAFIPPGTAGLGGYFTPIGQSFDTMNFGTGTAGDGSGTLGMKSLSASNLTAGAAAPANFTVFTSGTTGSTTYTYACTAVTANGESPAGTGTTTVGNATLSVTNFNQPKCYGVPGAQSLNIYRTVGGATQGFLANVPAGNGNFATAQVFDDTGITANPARMPPTTNTTGTLTVYGPTTASSLTVSGPGNGISAVEGAAPSGVALSDLMWPDSTDHRWAMNNNNGGKTDVVGFSDLISASLFGVAKVDGTTITATSGVISANLTNVAKLNVANTFTAAQSAPSYAGSGTATFTPGTGWTGSTAACVTGVVCDSVSGTFLFTVGGTAGTVPTAFVRVNFPVTRTNNPSCIVSVSNSTASSNMNDNGTSPSWMDIYDMTSNPLVASTAYTVTYICGGN